MRALSLEKSRLGHCRREVRSGWRRSEGHLLNHLARLSLLVPALTFTRCVSIKLLTLRVAFKAKPMPVTAAPTGGAADLLFGDDVPASGNSFALKKDSDLDKAMADLLN